MKAIVKLFLLAFLLSSCASGRYALKPVNLYKGPNLAEAPAKVTIFFPILPMVNDVVNYDNRIIAWNVGIWDKKGQEEFCLALRLGLFDGQGRKYLVAVYPHPLASLVGKRVGLLGHCGQHIYNLAGQERPLKKSWGKIDLSEYKDFLAPVKAGSKAFVEMDKNSEEFRQLVQIYKSFWVISLNEEAAKYGYKKMVSSLSQPELEDLASRSAGVKSFLKWLGEDWKVIFSIPVLPPEEILANMVIAKIFTLPNLWAEEIDRIGCIGSHPRAGEVARMIDRYFKLYAAPYWRQKQTERRRE